MFSCLDLCQLLPRSSSILLLLPLVTTLVGIVSRNCPSLSTPTHPCCGSLQIFRDKQAPAAAAAPRFCCCCCLLVEFHGMLQTTSLSTTAAGSPTPAPLLPQPFFFFFFSQLGTCFKQLSETLQANQDAAAAAACARSKLSELGEGLT